MTVDLETASIPELKDAVGRIYSRITEMDEEERAESNDYIYSGNNTAIVNLDYKPETLSRFCLKTDDSDYQWELDDSDGNFMSTMKYASIIPNGAHLGKLLIQTQKPWTLDASPITANGSPYLKGNGACVTDGFKLPELFVIRFAVEYPEGVGKYYSSRFGLELAYLEPDGSIGYKAIMPEGLINQGESNAYDLIVRIPDDIVQCMWCVICEECVNWEITAQ